MSDFFLSYRCISEKDNHADVWKYNLPFFFFLSFSNIRMDRVREGPKWLSCTRRTRGTNLRGNLPCFRSKPSWLYNKPEAHACQLPNLRSISATNIYVMFNLGTRCISWYSFSVSDFRCCIDQCQKGSSSQYPTLSTGRHLFISSLSSATFVETQRCNTRLKEHFSFNSKCKI